MLGAYIKPVHVILFRIFDNKLTACLVNNAEAEQLTVLLKTGVPGNVWLSDSQNTVLAGTPPDTIFANPKYLSLIEQIRFFGGKCKELLESATDFLWLSENTNNKLEYFEKNIMPYREEAEQHDLIRLRSCLSNQNLKFDYIKAHACENLTDFDWSKEFPNTLPSEISELKILAQALHAANQEHLKTPLTQQYFTDKYILSPAALMLVMEHINVLTMFEQRIIDMSKTLLEKFIFADLTVPEQHLIQTMFNFDPIELSKQYAKSSNFNQQIFNLKILVALIQSPILKNRQS